MTPAVLLALALSAIPGPEALWSRPVPAAERWRSDVVDPRRADVFPRRVIVEGDRRAVDNPGGLRRLGGGVTTIRATGAGSPRLILDLGVNTGGRVDVDLAGGDGSTLRLAYSEARRYLTPVGDTTGGSLGTGDDPNGRFDTLRTGDGLRWRSAGIRGGQRWILLQLDGPGTVSIDAVRVRVTHLRARPRDYAGHFLSSDPMLNRAWYASAYTYNTSVAGDPPVLMDGAKRDRLVFTGDLALGQLVGLHAVRAGRRVARNSLALFPCLQAPDGNLPGFSDISRRCPARPEVPLRSGEYVAWYVVAVADYWRLTGDRRTVRQLLPVLRRAIQFLGAHEAGGLYTASPDQGFEYNWRARANFGASSYTNIVYYRALRGLAELERRIGGRRAAARSLERHAAALRSALRRRLWDRRAGAFRVNTLDITANHAQDANVQALVAGLLARGDGASALRFVDTRLATRFGTKSSELDDDPLVPQYISPFTSSWELLARFEQGDARGALDLMRRLWGRMTSSDPGSTGWEKMALDGTPQPNSGAGLGLPTTRPEGEGYVSLAHAWSGGPVPALSGYVLGVRPAAPGFARWTVAPAVGDLRWAQGQVPTPRGPIVSRWTRAEGFRLTVVAPRASRGTVAVPVLGSGRTIARDGRVVWRDGRPTGGVSARRVAGAVRFAAGGGRHTYAWAEG